MGGPLIDRRRLRLGLGQLRRDLAALRQTLLGNALAPVVRRGFVGRPPLAETPQRAGLAHRRLRVTSVVGETPDAVSIGLEDVSGAPITHVAGQFLTLELVIDGRRHRRAYSICTPPGAPEGVMVTVKRVAGGVVSGFLTNRVGAGFELDALGPSGTFVRSASDGASRLVFIGAGSGITPLMALLRKTLLIPGPPVSLVYGNRGETDVIFAERLANLAQDHPDRFDCRVVLEDPPEGWTGGQGRLDAATLERELVAMGVFDDPAAHYFVCGPGPVLDHADSVLATRGIDTPRIHRERFQSLGEQRVHPVTAQTVHATVEATSAAAASARTFVVAPGETLLEAGVAAGLPMPFSCAMGGCAACKVHVTAGEVAMDEPNCLSPEERAAGYVLACVSRPLSTLTIAVSP